MKASGDNIGADEAKRRLAYIRKREQQILDKYEKIADRTGIKAQKEKMSFVKGKNSALPNVRKAVDNSGKSDIMNEEKEIREHDVHYITKIDKNIYKCISKDIITDEVVITEERINHIMERHPQDYERYCGYLKDIVVHPEYIIETNKPNTALILKSFSEKEEEFKTVLRLITSTDNKNYKNSVITFMKINQKEWKRLIKNKKVLYKAE